MKKTIIAFPLIIFGILLYGCSAEVHPPQVNNNSTPSASASEELPIALPALDALLSDKAFKTALKSKVRLTDEQIAALKKVTGDELARIPPSNSDNKSAGTEDARHALRSIRDLFGKEKADEIFALALERRSSEPEPLPAKDAELAMLKGPNAVPVDTRIVVNIPAFRMDLFRDGVLLKSYKVGIGYKEFPLPTGFRKAEMIIFNPTWTQPNESWASNPGEVVPAGDKGNPLGPIKIPIGGANLIHGGKSLAKIGTFASHGCVGLTNDQVKEFAKVLAQGTNTELKEETITAYLKKKTRTQVVKLSKIIPVELRYETIVIQEGKLHVYRDVYSKNTNTEENLRAVFAAIGVSFDTLTEKEKAEALEAVNALSIRPKKQPASKPTIVANQGPEGKRLMATERKAEAEHQSKLRNQKEIVIDLASLSGKGYPLPKDLNTGVTTAPTIAAPAKPKPLRRNPTPTPQSPPRTSPTPARRSTPEAVQPLQNTVVPQ
ncbi:MAG TPA: L,D-transpeptidase [Pyrinomonadaceae bacterium]|nr:L,D-transpeptidase [Pyrinomonadaceae bacterium]